jgi:hypothetical protein
MQPPVPPSPQPSLPIWAQLLSLGIALILAVLRLIEFFRPSHLHVHLTRDLFFRLIDKGEALFCNAVVIARGGSVLVLDVKPKLRRVNNNAHSERAEKVYPLEVAQFGEKVRGSQFTAENHFYSSSPLTYLPDAQPYRAVYLCFQKEYQPRQQKVSLTFVAEVLKLKSTYTPANPELLLGEDARLKLLQELDELIKSTHRDMVQLVQLEAGDYVLDVIVTYENPGRRFWKSRGEVNSSLGFSVEEEALNTWKAQLLDTLRISAQNLLENKTDPIRYPELQPTRFQEQPRKD